MSETDDFSRRRLAAFVAARIKAMQCAARDSRDANPGFESPSLRQSKAQPMHIVDESVASLSHASLSEPKHCVINRFN